MSLAPFRRVAWPILGLCVFLPGASGARVLFRFPEAPVGIGRQDGVSLMKQAQKLEREGKFEEAAATYGKAASAFEAEKKTDLQAQALKKSAEMYEKLAGDLTGPTPKQPPRIPTNPAPGKATGKQASTPQAIPKAAGAGLMTKQEIIGYMRAHGYVNGVPKRDHQVAKNLIEQIKRRGVVERLGPGDDLQCFAENEANYGDTDVVAATGCNLGTPTTLKWLAGRWLLYVIGGVVDRAPGDGYVYRKNESIGKLGFLEINVNGTYTWKVGPSDPRAKYVTGRWRNATAEEMKLQGGAGVVLQKAAEGADWIVFKYMDPFNKAERVEVEHIKYRGAYRRIGWRG